MLYLIVAASLIVANNAGCTQTGVDVDCANEKTYANIACSAYGICKEGTTPMDVVCDVRGDGTCTVQCTETQQCTDIGVQLTQYAGYICDLTVTPSVCAATPEPTSAPIQPTPKPTSSPSRTGDTSPPTSGPTQPTPHPTSAPNTSARTCTAATECAAKLADTVNTVATSISDQVPTPLTPDNIGEEYICVDGQCTVTCNDPNYGVTAIDADLLCQYVEDALIAEGETVDLECATTSGTGNDKACVEPVPTTTSEPDCDDDPCSLRDECTLRIFPDSIAGMCSVKIEYDLDVCVLNKGNKRYDIMADIIDACIVIGGRADEVCSGGLWAIEAYECSRIDGAYFDFFDSPTDSGECPDNVQAQCKNVKRSANIKGSAGLYCPCDNKPDLFAIRDKILTNAVANANFAEACLSVSITGDPICDAGFGAVEANKLEVTFRNSDGQIVGDVIDINGNGAKRMCYYIASVVVLIIVTFL